MSDNPVSTDGATPEGNPVSTDETTTEGKTFSEDYVKKLRDENAAARVAKKEAVDAAKIEVRAEVVAEYEPQIAERDTRITELETAFADQSLELAKLRAVIAAKVPTDDIDTVAGLVQGTDDESIGDSVKRVMSIYGKKEQLSPPIDPSQGAGGTTPLNGDKIANLLKRAVGA